MRDETDHPGQRHVIGIAGGLGPFAHIQMERNILAAAGRIAGARADQEFPEWVVSCVPQTPDRTLAIQGKAPDPVPWLKRSIDRLEQAGAGFALVPCITAHNFLPRVRPEVGIEVLDLVRETARHIAARWPGIAVGVLATSGTLGTGIFHRALEAEGLVPVSPLDLEDGETKQTEWVMEAIYGPLRDGRHTGGGIKTAGVQPEHVALLERAGRALIAEKAAGALITGCTEIPLALPGEDLDGVPLADPMKVIAEVAIRRAFTLD